MYSDLPLQCHALSSVVLRPTLAAAHGRRATFAEPDEITASKFASALSHDQSAEETAMWFEFVW